MPAIHRQLAPTRNRQNALGAPGNRPTDLVPHPESSRLAVFIARFFHLSSFLSSGFIIIGDVLTPSHGMHGHSLTRSQAEVYARAPMFFVSVIAA
jgi:hypothetical protein